MKNVIHIFGGAGSGTTTLGHRICEELGYKHMDTDEYYWLPTEPRFTQKRSVEERLKLMIADIERYDNIVISGSLTDWGDVLIPYFSLAIRIELSADIRVARIKDREKSNSTIERIVDMKSLYLFMKMRSQNYRIKAL